MNKNYRYITFAIAMLGSCLAAALLLQDRSVFLDEANLIRNIYELGFLELAGPLRYEQSAPFLFTWLVKGFTLLTGTSSISYRLFPCLAVIASIWILRSVVLYNLSIWSGSLILYLYSFHELTMRYASECKQYGADLLVSILLLQTALSYPPTTRRIAGAWVLLGCISILLSMSSVLILAAIGTYWLAQYRNEMQILKLIVFIGSLWILAFLLNYELVLSEGINSEHMQAYHAKYFLNTSDIEILGRQLLAFVRLIAKKTVIGIIAVVLLFFLGVINIWRQDPSKVLLYLVPIVTTCILSALGLYSLLERLLLFLLPIVVIVAGYGLDFLVKSNIPKRAKLLLAAILTAALLLASYHRTGLKWFSTLPMEDLKSVLIEKETNEQNHIIFLSKHVYASYYFYTDIYPIVRQSNISIGTLDQTIVSEILVPQGDTMWVVLSHVPDLESETARIKQRYELIHELSAKGTNCLLVTNPQ